MKKSFYLSGLLFCCMMLSFMGAKASTGLTIFSNPGNDTVCSGATAKFILGAIDTPGVHSLSYSWLVSTDGGTTWSVVRAIAPYSDTSSDTLIVASSLAVNGYMFMGIATDGTGSDTSTAAMLVVDTLDAGTIAGPSAVCAGSSIVLTDAVTGGVWTVTNGHATMGGGLVTGASQGFDTVKYTVTNKCGTIPAWSSVRIDTTVIALPITGPDVTCVGHFIDLMNVNVLGTWTWTENTGNASVTSAGVVTGLAAGNDTITYNFANSCNSVSSSHPIRVDAPLYAGVISGPTAVCAGSDISLTETVSGGTWLSSNSSIAVVDGSGDVTGVAQGTVTISYFLSNGCGASVATYTVAVAAMAATISGSDSVGIGNTVTLIDTTTGGTWSSEYDTVATISSTGLVSGIATGVTTITYSVTNACGTTNAYLTMNVGVHPSIPAITGGDSVCLGNAITLTDAIGGGKWSSKYDSIATVDSVTGVVTGVRYGSDTISYRVTTGFGTSVIKTSVFVNRPPLITMTGPSIIALGGDYFPVAQPYGGTWTVDNDTVGRIVYSNISRDTTYIDSVRYTLVSKASFVVTGYGSATIIYTDRNTCGIRSDSFIVNLPIPPPPISVAGVNNVPSSLNVYPNPNQGEFVINLSSGNNELATVTITNVVGEKVKQFEISTNKNVDINLDAPAGIYLINATTASGKYSSKVTIAK